MKMNGVQLIKFDLWINRRTYSVYHLGGPK